MSESGNDAVQSKIHKAVNTLFQDQIPDAKIILDDMLQMDSVEEILKAYVAFDSNNKMSVSCLAELLLR